MIAVLDTVGMWAARIFPLGASLCALVALCEHQPVQGALWVIASILASIDNKLVAR